MKAETIEALRKLFGNSLADELIGAVDHSEKLWKSIQRAKESRRHWLKIQKLTERWVQNLTKENGQLLVTAKGQGLIDQMVDFNRVVSDLCGKLPEPKKGKKLYLRWHILARNIGFTLARNGKIKLSSYNSIDHELGSDFARAVQLIFADLGRKQKIVKPYLRLAQDALLEREEVMSSQKPPDGFAPKLSRRSRQTLWADLKKEFQTNLSIRPMLPAPKQGSVRRKKASARKIRHSRSAAKKRAGSSR